MPGATTISCYGVGAINLTRPNLEGFRLIEERIRRAIVDNEAVGQEGDKGQDMGSYNLESTFEGIIRGQEAGQNMLAILKSFAAVPQFTPSYPSGRCAIVQSDDRGYIQLNLTNLAIWELTTRYEGGFPQRWRFFLTVRRYMQT